MIQSPAIVPSPNIAVLGIKISTFDLLQNIPDTNHNMLSPFGEVSGVTGQ